MKPPKKLKPSAIQGIVLAIIFIAGVILLAAALKPEIKTIDENESVQILKDNYPEFKNYPNDNFPPKAIYTENSAEGWYVAFVQEGSGRPIINATCFLVKNDGSLSKTGEYNPQIIAPRKFSIKTCS